jgi:UDP:flavonoid glycosyltransferase YjiC (YdhE family)
VTRRILFSVAGSAGDLFPLVPVMRALREDGNDVRCAVVPRSLAFYLRPLGIPVYPVGAGNEVAALRKPQAVTTRFGGWASLRELAHTLLLDSLGHDVASHRAIVAEWCPDVIVSSSFAPSSRIVARRLGIGQVDVTIYPLLARVPTTRLAWRLTARCAELAGLDADAIGSPEAARLTWGVGTGTVLLHDPALIRHGDYGVQRFMWEAPVGFPSWDDALRREADVDMVARWLERSDDPTVIVTMGSYLGVGRPQLWTELAEAVDGLGVRGLFLGPVRELEEMLSGFSGDFRAARFVPLSQVVGQVAALVHHGGTGTMVAALRSGVPSVVKPLAFDQAVNGRLVDAAGVGVDVSGRTVRTALELVLADPSFRDRSAALASELVPADVAAKQAAARVLAGGQAR